MLKNFLLTLLRVLQITLVLTLERVIGLPLISSLLVLAWLDRDKDLIYKFPILVLIFSLLLAVIYSLSWPLAYLWWLSMSLMINLGEKIVPDKKRRFLIVVLAGNLFLMWWLQLSIGYLTLAQLIISYIFSLLWMRIFKFDRVVNSY